MSVRAAARPGGGKEQQPEGPQSGNRRPLHPLAAVCANVADDSASVTGRNGVMGYRWVGERARYSPSRVYGSSGRLRFDDGLRRAGNERFHHPPVLEEWR